MMKQMEIVPPKVIASCFFKRFMIVLIGLALAGFSLNPIFSTTSTGYYAVSDIYSPKSHSDIVAFLNANGFRLAGALSKPGNSDEFRGRYEGSLPFMVSVGISRSDTKDFMIVSVSYHFRGFKWKVDDSENKAADFDVSLNACLGKRQAVTAMDGRQVRD